MLPLNRLASPSIVFLRTKLRKKISCRHQKDEVYLWYPFTVQYFVYDQSPWAACESQFPWIFKWHFYQAYQNNTLWYFKDLQGHFWAILKFISVKQSAFHVSNKQCLWLVSVTKLEKNWKCGVLKQRRLTTPATCDRKPNTFASLLLFHSALFSLHCRTSHRYFYDVQWFISELKHKTKALTLQHVHLPFLRWYATEINRIAHFVNRRVWWIEPFICAWHILWENHFKASKLWNLGLQFKLSVITCKEKENQL